MINSPSKKDILAASCRMFETCKMHTFLYRVVHETNAEQLDGKLNDLAQEGWEIDKLSVSADMEHLHIVVLLRKLTDQAQLAAANRLLIERRKEGQS